MANHKQVPAEKDKQTLSRIGEVDLGSAGVLAIGGVEIRDARPRAADRELLAHARDGIYDRAKRPAALKIRSRSAQDVADFVTVHGRGFEARDALASSNDSTMGGGECRVICSVWGRAQ